MKTKQLQAKRDSGTHAKQGKSRAAKRAALIVQSADAAFILGTDRVQETSSARVSSKWRWHHRVLLSLQNQLLQERGERLQSAAEPIEPHSLDEADSATDEFDHDLALTQLSAGQDALYEVNDALNRIRNGTYGICEETGEVIPAARLRAVPWARYSMKVENRLEKGGATSRARLRQAGTVRGNGLVSFAPGDEAEESEEKLPAPPKHEASSKLLSPPGRPASHPTAGQRPSVPASRKGQNK